MNQIERDALDDALNALERLMRIFQAERILYLVGAFASVVLFVYASYKIFSTDKINTEEMVIILGASSVSAACSGRVAFFLNKSFKLIEDIIRKITSTGEQS